MFITSLPRRFFTTSGFPHCIGEGGGLLLWDKKDDKVEGGLEGYVLPSPQTSFRWHALAAKLQKLYGHPVL
jgi:hypothetical protein